jgi:hypothetical protein
MASPYATGKIALGVCDVCGFTYHLKELKEKMVKGRKTGVLACPECWDPSHPQLRLGEFPVYDPQALRNPRTDTAQFAQSRALILPVSGVSSRGTVARVQIVIS